MFTRIGKYTIESEIGRGGFGQVYRAHDPSVGRPVAIKVLKPGADQSLLTRFRNEAVAAGNLQHKNIVTVYEFGEQDGQAYLVMEFLQGRDLQHVLQEEAALSLLQKVQIMSQVASGLHFAHIHGVVHRDVKPANIMILPDGTVKIMDFGIARLLYATGAAQTQTGFMIGSLLYMSPEQFGAGPIDALCDIWGFGVIFYELMTGRHPFPAAEPAAAMYMIQRIEPAPVRELAPGCPQAIADIIARALAKDRELRYQSLEDLRIDAEPILLRLQKEEADALARTAQEQVERNDWDAVQSTVKQILELDSTNQVARQLREAMRQRSKRQSIRPRVEALLKQGVEQLSMRQFRAAIDAFESALRLDASDSAIRSRLVEATSKLEQSRKAAELIRSAKASLDARNFTTAFEHASEALRLDPENPDALAALSVVRTEAERQDAELAVQQGLEKARGLLLLQSFDEALSVLLTLKSRYPPSTAVERAIAEIEQQKLEHDRRQRLRSHVESSKDLLKRGAVADAAARLQSALIDFPEDRELQQLLSYTQQQLEAQRRAEALQRVRAEAQRLMETQDYDAALQAIEIALKAHPGDAGLIALLQSAVAGKAAQRREAAILGAIRRAEVEARQNRLPEALEIVTQAAGEYPDDPRLPAIRDRLSERLRQMEKSAAIRKAITEARDLLKAQEAERAVALLQSSIARFPDADELRQALDAARREKAAQDEQRAVMAALERARGLEQEDQWAAAFGIITAALRTHPDSESLRASEARLRQRMAEEDRRYAATRERAEIEELIAARRYADALDRIERARKADASDESFQQQSKRVQSLIREECDRYAARIRSALQAGDLGQAEESLLEGLRVLPGENALLALKRDIELERECRQWVLTARTQLESGEFDNAERSAKQALKIKPDDPPAKEVLREIDRRRADQDRKRRIDHARKSVRELLAKRRFNEARKFLHAAIENFPDVAEFHADLTGVDEAQQKHEEQEQIEAQVARLLKLQRAGNAQEVLTGARQLLSAAPGEARARELAAWAEQTIAQARQEREQSIAQGSKTARSLGERAQFQEARATLNALLKRFPDATELREELAAVDVAEQRRREQDQRNEQITVLIDLQKAGNARQVLAGATQLLAVVPDETRARELAGWAQQAIADEQARIAQEKAERERREREAAERARLEREQSERERREREAAERERLEREKAERARLEWEKAERVRREREAAERERLEREKAEQARLEREKAERERQEREAAERARREREAAAQKRLERENAERARVERESVEHAAKKAAAAAQAPGGTLVSGSQEVQAPVLDTRTPVPLTPAQDSRKRTRTWIAAAALVVVMAGAAWMMWGHRPPPPPALAPLQVDLASISETTPATTAIHKTMQVSSASPRSFAAAPTATWLHVSSSSTQTPAVLDIDIDPAALSAGNYAAAIELRGSNGAIERSIPVHLTVPKATVPETPTSPAPVLSVSAGELRFECEAASSQCEAKHIAIATNGPSRTFQAREQAGTGWLSVTPHAGNTPATMAVEVNTKSLREGNYSASILVQAEGEKGPAKAVRVSLTVRPAKKIAQAVPPPQQQQTSTPTTPPVVEPPKINPVQPPTGTTPPPQVVTPNRPYGGAPSGRFYWSGTLGPNQQIIFTPDGVQGGGTVTGNKLPGGIDVNIVTTPPDLVRKEVPSPANRFNKLVLANPGSAPINSIVVRWNLK